MRRGTGLGLLLLLLLLLPLPSLVGCSIGGLGDQLGLFDSSISDSMSLSGRSFLALQLEPHLTRHALCARPRFFLALVQLALAARLTAFYLHTSVLYF